MELNIKTESRETRNEIFKQFGSLQKNHHSIKWFGMWKPIRQDYSKLARMEEYSYEQMYIRKFIALW